MDFPYATLPYSVTTSSSRSSRWKSMLVPAATASLLFLLLAVVALVVGRHEHPPPATASDPLRPSVAPSATSYVPRGVREGVSEKSTGIPSTAVHSGEPAWTNDMLYWQRSAFHFQPEKNWMNDPNGPAYHKGWYHLFYQYNPDSAVWGNITWGHAVSRDLIHWLHLPLAMVADRWYDANGVWSGSAVVLPDSRIFMIYTGSTNASVQVQNVAVPADPEDPLLLAWLKSDAVNPVLRPPPGIALTDFRDPTTAWYAAEDSSWRIAIGSKNAEHAGLALVYRTKDFIEYQPSRVPLHTVPGTGMWECVDFYPVSTTEEKGLDTSAHGPTVKHVLKASLDDDKHDYYAIGTLDLPGGVWMPDDAEKDVGVGLRLDYGRYYASKTFYDPIKQRRVLFGWVAETDSELVDIRKGWASLQAIPRTVRFDEKTKSNLIQWPVAEVEELRMSSKQFSNVEVAAGSVVPLDVGRATQLDIMAEFKVEEAGTVEAENVRGYNCSTSGGAAARGAMGPFGLLVLADEGLSEQTAVYFYVARGVDGKRDTVICQDELRSSKARDVVKGVYGSVVPVLDGEKLSLRVLVDHSIVESFAQSGRTCVTSRVYPTRAIYGAARVFLFNNATGARVVAESVKLWDMDSAFIRPFDLHKDGIDPKITNLVNRSID